jgi:hypothetical protein
MTRVSINAHECLRPAQRRDLAFHM